MPFGSPRYLDAGGGSPRVHGPATPAGRRLPPVVPRRFGRRPPFARRYSGDLAVDFFSSGYLDVSVPRVVLPQGMCSQGGCRILIRRVRPFGDPRVEGCVPLTADYRSLPRPSSASCAKASAARPAYLLKKTLCRGGLAAPGCRIPRRPQGAPAIRCCDLTLIKWYVAESIVFVLSYRLSSDFENRCREGRSLPSRYAALRVRGAMCPGDRVPRVPPRAPGTEGGPDGPDGRPARLKV